MFMFVVSSPNWSDIKDIFSCGTV